MNQKLINEAFLAMKNAYAPYSNYHVGAAVLLNDGKIIYGANIVNASYGATSCAERNALFAAYSMGYRSEDIKELAIVSDGANYLAYPCGICRQVIKELVSSDTKIHLSNKKESKTVYIDEILPGSFTAKDLQ